MYLGSHVECQYALMTFGIPTDLFPIKSDGSLDLTHHNIWLNSMAFRQEEAVMGQKEEGIAEPSVLGRQYDEQEENNNSCEPPSTNTIVIPGRMDVIMGRGKHPTGRPGNM